MLSGVVVAVAAGLLGLATTYWLYRSAHRIGLVAEVNHRSSHSRATPSGGGIGIVVGGTIGAALAILAQPWPAGLVATLALGVALLGFLDDRHGLPVAVRLPIQLILAGSMAAILPYEPLAAAIGLPIPPLLLGLLVVIATVYWTNIFNFMDGIDGIAASEAIFVLLSAVVLAILGGVPADHPLLWWVIAIAAATFAFLLMNWPPARIFMGDAGSTYLGFMIAFVAFTTIATGWLTMFQWMILVATFVVDATLTLTRRLVRCEPIFKAHRLHAYQHLSRRWGHRPVTLATIALNVCILLPVAWLAGASESLGGYLVTAVYTLLMVALLLAGSGAPEVDKPATNR